MNDHPPAFPDSSARIPGILLALFSIGMAATPLSASPLSATPLFRAPFGHVGISDQLFLKSTAVALGDLNRDGSLDLVSQTVVQVGYGDGTFEPVSYWLRWDAGSQEPHTILLADFDRDSALDALIENHGFSIMIGNDNGRLGFAGLGSRLPAPKYYYAPTSSYALSSYVVGDLNVDGWPDVARAEQGSNVVQVSVNARDGTFPHRIDFTVPSPSDLALGDVTGDGFLDLLSTGGAEGISVLGGFGDGDFASLPVILLPKPGREIEVGDLNGDQIPDIATLLATAGTDGIAISFGRPMGGVESSVILTTPLELRSLRLFDTDHDDDLDLVATSGGVTGPGRIAVLRGDGGGGFSPAELSAYGVGKGPFVIDRIDGDAFADIAAVSPDGVSILLGQDGARFGEDHNVPHPPTPESAKLVDVDGDGLLDALLVFHEPSSVLVLRGLSDGNFAPPFSVDLGADRKPDVFKDLDSDGFPEMVARGERDVVVARGHGDLTFDPPISLPVPGIVNGSFVEDVDGDGHLDVVVWAKGSTSSTFHVWLGLGNGTFGTRLEAFQINKNVQSVVFGDVNGDGRSDLVVNCVGFFRVGFAQPDGSFIGITESRPGHLSRSIRLSDLNRDGRLDLVSIGHHSGSNTQSLIPMLGDGAGSFSGLFLRYYSGQEPYWTSYPVAVSATSLEIADLDGDGIPDVAVPIRDSHVISIRRGLGDGSLEGSDYGPGPAYKVAGAPRQVLIGDVDHDGTPDLMAFHAETGTFTFLANTGCAPPRIEWIRSEVSAKLARLQWRAPGSLDYSATVFRRAWAQSWIPLGKALIGPDGIATFDDTSVRAESTYSYRLGTRVGSCETFAGETQLIVPRLSRLDFSSPGVPLSIAAADIDGDGRSEVVTADHVGHSISLHRSRLDGSFDLTQVICIAQRPYTLQSADLNRDGVPDFVAGCVAELTADSSCLTIVLGNQDGSLGPARRLITGGNPINLKLDDFNGDSIPDAVCQSGGTDRVSVFLGIGDGTFDRGRVTFTSGSPWLVDSGDLNEDGFRDLVIVNYRSGGNVVSVHLGHGDGTFDNPISRACSQWFRDLLVADLDGDTHLDVSISEEISGSEVLSILRGMGTGGFHPDVTIPLALSTGSLFVKDMDGDGRSDLVGAVESFSPRVLVLRNRGGLVFDLPIELISSVGATQVRVLNWNGNDAPDLVVANERSISIFADPMNDPTATQASLISIESTPDSIALRWSYGMRSIFESSVDRLGTRIHGSISVRRVVAPRAYGYSSTVPSFPGRRIDFVCARPRPVNG